MRKFLSSLYEGSELDICDDSIIILVRTWSLTHYLVRYLHWWVSSSCTEGLVGVHQIRCSNKHVKYVYIVYLLYTGYIFLEYFSCECDHSIFCRIEHCIFDASMCEHRGLEAQPFYCFGKAILCTINNSRTMGAFHSHTL